MLGSLSLLLLVVLALMYLPPARDGHHFSQGAGYRFPWWGWVAVVLLLTSWILAWSRFAWFRPLQPYTFTPLWLSYIAVINALTYRRVGACMITHRRQYLLALFPFSALFWWYFEYLNRFVQNWYYVGHETYTPFAYTVHATLAFSTVLPAVTSTMDLLSTYAALNHTRLRKPLVARHGRAYAGFVLSLAAFGLAGIAVWSDYLYPLLWVAPLCVLVSLQILLGQETVLSKLAQGHWHLVGLSAMAALVCGLFWEMWNYYSYAKWVYAIPHVQRAHHRRDDAKTLARRLRCIEIRSTLQSRPSRLLTWITVSTRACRAVCQALRNLERRAKRIAPKGRARPSRICTMSRVPSWL